jgi:hypothetical protein
MSTTRVHRRLAAALAATAGGVVLTLSLAAPAFAAESIDVNVNLSSSATAGSRPGSLRTTMQNRTDAEIRQIRRVIVIRLAGLTPSSVRVTHGIQPMQMQSGTAGEVLAIDSLQVRLGPSGHGGSTTRDDYAIAFLASSPNGKAGVTFQAEVNEQVLGSETRNITVKGGSGQAEPTSSVAAETGPVGTVAPEASVTYNPLPEQQGAAAATKAAVSTGVPVAYYVMGTILLAAGGVILWLLFKRKPEVVLVPADYPTGGYEQVRPTALGYPQRADAAVPAPTTFMPRVHGGPMTHGGPGQAPGGSGPGGSGSGGSGSGEWLGSHGGHSWPEDRVGATGQGGPSTHASSPSELPRRAGPRHLASPSDPWSDPDGYPR